MIDFVVCITSAHLHEDPTDFASGLDSVTGEPVGVRYRVWLDTKKPIYLAPDVCSTWFYAKHLRELAGHVYPGTEPSTDLLERLRDAA